MTLIMKVSDEEAFTPLLFIMARFRGNDGIVLGAGQLGLHHVHVCGIRRAGSGRCAEVGRVEMKPRCHFIVIIEFKRLFAERAIKSLGKLSLKWSNNIEQSL